MFSGLLVLQVVGTVVAFVVVFVVVVVFVRGLDWRTVDGKKRTLGKPRDSGSLDYGGLILSLLVLFCEVGCFGFLFLGCGMLKRIFLCVEFEGSLSGG